MCKMYGIILLLFLMHFSPRLYVFVVCSICKRKKNVLVEHLIHAPVFGLGHNGIILYMLLFVCCFFLSITFEVKPMFGECIDFSCYPMQPHTYAVDQTFDSITPNLTKPKALSCRYETRQCTLHLPWVQLQGVLYTLHFWETM